MRISFARGRQDALGWLVVAVRCKKKHISVTTRREMHNLFSAGPDARKEKHEKKKEKNILGSAAGAGHKTEKAEKSRKKKRNKLLITDAGRDNHA